MASEAQRLINISLGKIASSRSQRGGLRLHKSLMVANIIVQARTQALMETATSPIKYQLASKDVDDSGDRHVGREESGIHESFRSSTFKQDYDSDSDSSLDSDEEMSVDFELDFGKASEENDPPPSPRKRRRSEEDDGEPNLHKPAKKFFPSPELCSFEVRGGSLTSVDCTNGLLDSLQMCHLTQMEMSNGFASHPSVFDGQEFHKLSHHDDHDDFQLASAGFNKAQPVYDNQGFVKSSTSSDTYDIGIDESDYNKDISLFQADGLTDVVSCSTQIREALETLTRPVISLTV